MDTSKKPQSQDWIARISGVAPGLGSLLRYERNSVPYDLVAGLSVAAVALPVGVAYAELAGFNPAVGLYSSILPLLAYAIFGSSRQLIIGPDAATCALITPAVTPLAAGNQETYESLSVTLVFLAGLFCIAASFVKLGALADFLSKPILVGFLNGIALSIILGQIGKVFGYPISAGGIIPRLAQFVSKLGLTHVPTLAVGVGTFIVLLLTPRIFKQVPAAFVAMILAAIAVRFFGLEQLGVKIVGEVPAGLPHIQLPRFSLDLIPTMLGDSAGLALVSFSSMMLTSRSFASKNKYDVDADQEFAALGAANIASAISQGFAVSGADSRTAMSDATGGRTQVTGILLLRFNAPVVFFNAPYFKRELLAAVHAAGPSLRWVVLNMLPITMIDATGLQVTQEIAEELDSRGALLVAAGRQTEWQLWAETRRFEVPFHKAKTYPTLRTAIKTFLAITAVSNAAQRDCDPV